MKENSKEAREKRRRKVKRYKSKKREKKMREREDEAGDSWRRRRGRTRTQRQRERWEKRLGIRSRKVEGGEIERKCGVKEREWTKRGRVHAVKRKRENES